MYGVPMTPRELQAKPLYGVSSLYQQSTGHGSCPDDTLQEFQSALVASSADGGGQKLRGWRRRDSFKCVGVLRCVYSLWKDEVPRVWEYRPTVEAATVRIPKSLRNNSGTVAALCRCFCSPVMLCRLQLPPSVPQRDNQQPAMPRARCKFHVGVDTASHSAAAHAAAAPSSVAPSEPALSAEPCQLPGLLFVRECRQAVCTELLFSRLLVLASASASLRDDESDSRALPRVRY
ncbi:hypothetical protein ACQKWADRAFT_164430 [Trichoderma austrokoningii]